MYYIMIFIAYTRHDQETVFSDYAGGDGTYHLKVLVPGVAAGAIIGKGGDTIAQLQKDTGARVKMSKSHDFYPGTHLAFVHARSRGYLHPVD